MSEKKRGRWSKEQKFKIALAAVRGDKTIAQIAEEYKVHPNQLEQIWHPAEAQADFGEADFVDCSRGKWPYIFCKPFTEIYNISCCNLYHLKE